jgi:hypothetical protein
MVSIRASCNTSASGVGEADAPRAASPGTEEPSLDLETVSAVLEGGLLMVFGPDGDPLPPRAFCIAAAGQPDAGIRIGGDARARAGRVAAVLEAQRAGRLSAGDGDAGAWIEAMLGLGPQPAMCGRFELQAEDGACEIMRCGDGIRISIVGGRPLLLSPARPERPVEARYRLTGPDSAQVALADACSRLWGGTDLESAPAAPGAIAGCSLAWRDRGLVLTCGSFSLHLDPAPELPADATTVDLLSENGEPLTPRALRTVVSASVFDHEQALRVPLALPETLQLGRDGVLDLGCLAGVAGGLGEPLVSLTVAGLPEAAMLSSGTHAGNGVWRLAADDLPGLALFAIPERIADFDLALIFGTAARELSRRMRIEIERKSPAAGDRPAAMPGSEAHGVEAERFGGADTAMVIIKGVPAGGVLSRGIDNGDGSWSVPGEEAGEIGVALPAGEVRELRLVLTAIRIGGRDGGLTTMSREITLPPGEPIRIGLLDGPSPGEDADLPLELEDVVSELAGSARLDAIVVGGLPSGARLSKGLYDEGIASWVLRPDQLAGLVLEAAQARRVDLKVTAVAIDRATGGSTTRTRRLGLDLDAASGGIAACRSAGGVGFFRPLGSRRGLA